MSTAQIAGVLRILADVLENQSAPKDLEFDLWSGSKSWKPACRKPQIYSSCMKKCGGGEDCHISLVVVTVKLYVRLKCPAPKNES